MQDEQQRVSMVRYALVSAAFLVVIGILTVAVMRTVDSEYVQGVLTLVLGRMLGYVDAVYNYEFGNTRNSAGQAETIKEMTQTAATVATTAQATQVAADVVAAAGVAAQQAGGPSAPIPTGPPP